MKQNHYFKRTLSAMLLLMASSLSWAYDFSAKNANGVTIYYNLIKDGTEAEVTSGDEIYSGDIIIPSTVTYDGKTLSVTYIGNNAFSFCSSLTSIDIPNRVTNIGDYAFYECSGLTSINIPNSVTRIGIYAFGSCSSLTSIDIPNSVTRISLYAFARCSSLTSIVVDSNNPVFDSRNNCNAIIETASNALYHGCNNTVIPESVTGILDGAFWDCSRLTSITIPEGVTSIGISAFRGCSSLTSIVVDGNNPVYDSRNNCNAIIETESNTLIEGCNNTVIPKSVTSIGSRAFDGRSGLTSVNIPESVTSIGKNAFALCSGLTSVNIPEGVTSIGEMAFSYCSSLTSVYSSIKNPFSITSYVFYRIAADATLYVPQGTKDAYEAAEGWTTYFSNVVEFDITGISEVNPGQSAEGVSVYGLNGTKVNVKDGDLKSLPRGIYVVNGKKTIVK